jgi:HEAT repeat protein
MPKRRRLSEVLLVVVVGIVLPMTAVDLVAANRTAQQTGGQTLTPMQMEIEKQRQRLGSPEAEDRREALMRLRSLHQPDASRVALSALNDPSAMVRATAAESVLSLPANESAASLMPLLADKEEFVRQQVAYALGRTRSNTAVVALIERLADKKDSVRGAAAVALGQIGDATAVTSLAAILNPTAGLNPSKKDKSKRERNPFVLRAAAHSLGQIRNRAALPALIFVLQDENAEGDVRREAAIALGAIGDAAAIAPLNSVLMAGDPYLAEAAHEALRRISRSQSTSRS